MTQFRVWAPFAHTLALRVGDARWPMATTDQDHGWWAADVPNVPTDADYTYSIDDGDPLPDPRSPWQPAGVFGPSRLLDHAAFTWTDQQWQAAPLASAIIYELHIGTFTPEGTFDAAIEHLDHLKQLGVTHIELMPVHQFPGAHGWGYDGVDLYAPQSTYGGPVGLKRLVDACHARGLAVLLDVVYNHLGPSGNYLGRFGPYTTDRYNTAWGPAMNLDGPQSDEVRRFLCDNALMWLRDYHIDGLRLDAVHALLDMSAIHLLEQLSVEVAALSVQLGRHLVLIAESDRNDPQIIRAREAGGFGLNAQWSDDFHHALHALLTGERSGYYADFGALGDLAHALHHAYVYDGRYSAFRQRRHGRPAHGLDGGHFLGYMQNHDQIGNRAAGERSAALLSPQRLKIAAALVLTAPFIPMLFQGEEWAASAPFQYFTDHQDAELAHAVTQGRQREFIAFGWDPAAVPDPQAPATFARSKLDWSERTQPPHAEIYQWYQRLIALRLAVPALSDGRLSDVTVTYDDAAAAPWLVMRRGPACVACNLAERAQSLPLPPLTEPTAWRVALASEEVAPPTATSITLPANTVAILLC